jgi:hypothetical protein
MSQSVDEAIREMLIGYLISQGRARAAAEERVKADPDGVREEMEASQAAASSSEDEKKKWI